MNVVNIVTYFGILIILITVLPSIGILPLPAEFLSLLSTTFSFIKMIREWPILDEVFKGFNILLWYIGIKIAWNLLIFVIGLWGEFERLKKLKI